MSTELSEKSRCWERFAALPHLEQKGFLRIYHIKNMATVKILLVLGILKVNILMWKDVWNGNSNISNILEFSPNQNAPW